MTHGEGAQTMADTGTFPSLKKILRSDSFTDPTTESGDEVSKAYSGDITLEKALENYANKLAEQGKQQGYNVTVK